MQRLFYLLLVSAVIVFSGFTATLDEVLAGTVRIETFSESGSLKGRGSGFLISDQGLIVTNHHVMEGAASAIVHLSGGREFRQVIVEDFDEHKDLVLLRVEGIGLPTLSLGKSTESKTGDKIWVLGNTLGEYGNSVSQGVISGVRHNDAGFKYLQFTAAISPGNSGGPVLNENYEVVGVATATRTDGQNVNFAIPVNYVLGMVENRRGLTLAQYREM
ncbi:MAG: serine protease, partial [Candidatus Cloacimonetes bacterium]|nr:serine protease [Candidatus Cloacimonadota bacterium]